MKGPRRVIACYFRVSTLAQDYESQKYAVEAWIAALPPEKAPTKVRVYSDQVSGKAEKDYSRKGFQRLLKDVEEGKIDAVVVYALDRLSRDAINLLQLLMRWIVRDVEFFSVSQGLFHLGKDNPFRLTMLAVFSEISQIERMTIRGRINAGIAASKKRGTKFGRPRVITQESRREIRARRTYGASHQAIASEFGIAKSRVQAICAEPASPTLPPCVDARERKPKKKKKGRRFNVQPHLIKKPAETPK